MDNPGARFHSLPATRSRTGRMIGTVLVGAVHVVAIWALLNGLAGKIVQSVPKLIEARIVETPPPKQPPPPPRPEVKLQAPPKVVQAYVPPPDIKIATPPPPAPVQQVQQATPPPRMTPPPQPTPITPPAPPPAPAIPDSGPAGIASTHTTPPYPVLARRLGKEGTVTLSLSVSASGDVTGATVVSSSGNGDLDRAAIEWVKAHWRYKPAIRNGQPAAGTVQAAVRFTLQNAG